jgi:hypothetical protein
MTLCETYITVRQAADILFDGNDIAVMQFMFETCTDECAVSL